MELCDFMQQINLSDFMDTNDTYEYAESIASQVELVVRKLFPPVLILIGVIGNVVVFVCMRTLVKTAFPLCGYLCLVAVLDSVMLFIEAGNEWIHQVSLTNIVHEATVHSDTTCKLYNFGQSLMLHHNVWILVSFTIECIVLLYRPIKIQNITSRRILDTVAFISALLICANCHYFWTFGINRVEINYGCTQFVREFCSFQTRTLQGQLVAGAEDTGFFWSKMDQLLSTLVPLVIFFSILVMCIKKRKHVTMTQLKRSFQQCISLKMARNREKQANGQPYERKQTRIHSNTVSQLISRTMPALCIMFIVCHVPLLVHSTLEQYSGDYDTNGDAWSLTGVIFDILKNFSYSGKCILYICTCQSFRHTAKAMIVKQWYALVNLCSDESLYKVTSENSPSKLSNATIENV